MPKNSKTSKTKTRTQVEKLPARKQKVTSKDMKKVKGGIWLPGNYNVTDPTGTRSK